LSEIHNLASGYFEWQDDYIAVSVNDSQINRVRDYIKNQEQHHRKKSFDEEYREFLEKFASRSKDRSKSKI
jgi:putative transposase